MTGRGGPGMPSAFLTRLTTCVKKQNIRIEWRRRRRPCDGGSMWLLAQPCRGLFQPRLAPTLRTPAPTHATDPQEHAG